MARKKTVKKSQDFALPLSVLLFKEDYKSLRALSKSMGVPRSVLIRAAVHDAIKDGRYQNMMAS